MFLAHQNQFHAKRKGLKMKVKLYVHADYESWNKKWEFKTWQNDMTDTEGFGYCVQVVEIEFDFKEPTHDELVKKHILAMRNVQTKLRAETEVKIQNIEQQIQEMLCIEDKS